MVLPVYRNVHPNLATVNLGCFSDLLALVAPLMKLLVNHPTAGANHEIIALLPPSLP